MKYDPILAAKILDRLAETGSLRRVCAELHVSRNSIIPWVIDNTAGFGDAYARAKDQGIDMLVEETLDIADDGSNDYMRDKDGNERLDNEHIARSKVRVETRRWLAERMAPKRYGLKQGLDVTNTDGSLQVDETTRSARVAQLLALAAQRKDFEDLA